jgi:hypothetical protein
MAGWSGEPGPIHPPGPAGAEPAAVAKPHAGLAHYGAAVLVAVVIGVLVLADGYDLETAASAILLIGAVGIAYEWLADHHPASAKTLIVGLATAALAAGGALVETERADGSERARSSPGGGHAQDEDL